MQALKAQLEAVTHTLSTLTRTDVAALDDAKSLKSLAFVIDRVLDLLDSENCTLQQLKLRTLKKLEQRVSTVRPQLEAAEQKFLIQYQAVPRAPSESPNKRIQINFAGLTFACPLYPDRQAVPVLAYGAIMVRSQPMLVYRYSVLDFVSVTPCQVVEGDNIHTICCGNGATCEYGANCRYFHDPVEWPESQHVQKFQRSPLVKKCPTFGHAPLVTEHAGQLTFESLRTLARYCAVQALLIHLVTAR
jgi:hypothetical protein